jgi:predicted Rossmann fold flavoprotein
MAALFAARHAPHVVLLERTTDGGRKILISGGGRCNILPSQHEPERFVTASSSHSLRNILRGWPLDDQRAFFEHDLGLPLALEQETGKLFPVSNKARDVRDGLMRIAKAAGVRFRSDARVVEIARPETAGDPWVVSLERGEPLSAAAVVLATGGLSVPKTGSDGGGLAMARGLGHTIHPTYPALTPLLADPPRHAHLAGVSLRVSIHGSGSSRKFATSGGFLFTHRGYSGPTALDASHLLTRVAVGDPAEPIVVQWTDLDGPTWNARLQAERGTVLTTIGRHVPTRLAEQLLGECSIPLDRAIAQLTRDERHRLITTLTAYELPVTGDEGYKKAEVTGGGVALGEIDPRTMESRIHPGLFLCGEMLDAFGPIGGYNFQWAWATGRAAGLGAVAGGPPDTA